MLHCSSRCQLTGIKKINRTATVAGVHSFLLGWRINWGGIIRDGEFVIVLLWWPGGERLLVNYAENMRSQSGFRISEFQHWIGGTKPRQSLTRRAKFDEMWHVALDLDPCSFRGWKITSNKKCNDHQHLAEDKVVHIIVSLIINCLNCECILYFECTMGE